MASLSIALFTDVNDLVVPLASKLSKQNCSIDLVVEGKNKNWGKTLSKNVVLYNYKEFDLNKDKKKYDYILFIKINQKENTGDDLISLEKKYRAVTELAEANSAKILFIFPYVLKPGFKRKVEEFKSYLAPRKQTLTSLIYLGDLLGRKTTSPDNNRLGSLLIGASVKGKIKLSKDEVFFPVSIKSAVHQIIKNLFSFGYFGKEIALISSGIHQSKIIDLLKNEISDLKIKYKRGRSGYLFAETKGKAIIEKNEKKIILETINYVANNKTRFIAKGRSGDFKIKKMLEGTFGKKKIYFRNPKLKYKIFLFLIIVWPTISFYFVSSTQLIARGLFFNANTFSASVLFSFTQKSSSLIKEYLGVLPKSPIENIIISPSTKAAEILVRNSTVGLTVTSLMDGYFDLYEKVVGEENEDIEIISSQFSTELGILFKELGFLESEITGLKGIGKESFSAIVNKSRIFSDRQAVLYSQRIFNELPALLGVEGEKTYLLIFQNNLNLRPTGGKIVALSFVTFSKGKISNVETYLPDSLDARLKGYVKPPGAIEMYINENWYLSDANWDPDFPTAAEQIEWFVDKELDRSVDGVISFDLDFIKKLLALSGPIMLDGQGVEVSADSLYQAVVESSDSNIWKEILSQLEHKLTDLDDKRKMEFFMTTLDALGNKNIQVFLHNSNSQKALSGLGWEGSLRKENCYGNCFSDFIGYVESSTRENNLGHFLRRAAEITLSFEQGILKRKFLIAIENLSEKSVNGNNYAAFIRVIVPEGNGFSPIKVIFEDKSEEVVPEISLYRGFKEAGVFVEVKPQDTKVLQFSWEGAADVNLAEQGNYNLLLRKQAGMNELSTRLKMKGSPALTGNNELEYNTVLSRDFVSRIYW